MATIADICTTIEGLIIAGQPDYRTDLPYSLAATHVPFEELPVTDSWRTTTRSIRVIPTTNTAEGKMNGLDVDCEQDVEVKLRYWLDKATIDGDKTLRALAACDARRVINLVLRPNAATNLAPSGAQYINAFLADTDGPKPGKIDGLWYLTLTFRMRYLSVV
jgi:hypothetical protein